MFVKKISRLSRETGWNLKGVSSSVVSAKTEIRDRMSAVRKTGHHTVAERDRKAASWWPWQGLWRAPKVSLTSARRPQLREGPTTPVNGRKRRKKRKRHVPTEFRDLLGCMCDFVFPSCESLLLVNTLFLGGSCLLENSRVVGNAACCVQLQALSGRSPSLFRAPWFCLGISRPPLPSAPTKVSTNCKGNG